MAVEIALFEFIGIDIQLGFFETQVYDNVVSGNYIYQYNTYPKSKEGMFVSACGYDIFLTGIWIEPKQIDYGLITEEKQTEFAICNKNVLSKTDWTITSIIETGVDTEYIDRDLLNTTLKPNGYVLANVVVPKEGQVSINAVFTFSDGITSVDLSITGLRTIVIPIISDEYDEFVRYYTVIAKTRNLKEQRKIINDLNYLELKFTKKISDLNKLNIMNLSQAGQGKVVIVPILSELLKPQSALAGNSTFTFNNVFNDLVWIDYYNSHLIIIEKDDERKYSILEILSIDKANNTITTKTALDKDFTNPVAFMCLISYIKNIEITPINSEKVNLTLEVAAYVD